MSVTESIRTARLTLTPLDVADALEMVGVLSDPALYAFTGGSPPTLGQLEDLYRGQRPPIPRLAPRSRRLGRPADAVP